MTKPERAQLHLSPVSPPSPASPLPPPLRRVLRLLLALLLILPSSTGAQFGLAAGFRSLAGDATSGTDDDRRGFEGRVQFDRLISGAFGWRGELTGVQMQYQRDDGTDRYQVSESSIELGALLRASMPRGAFTGVYGLVGPVTSWRLVCGASGQNSTECDPGKEASAGYVLGVGYQSPFTPRRDLAFEVRFSDGVIAGAGAPILTVSFGLVWARRED